MENFFDKVAAKSKEVAKSVADTASDLVDKGKTKAAEIETNGKIKEELRKLGEIVYKAEKGAPDDAAKAASITALDELYKKLEELVKEEAEEKTE